MFLGDGVPSDLIPTMSGPVDAYSPGRKASPRAWTGAIPRSRSGHID